MIGNLIKFQRDAICEECALADDPEPDFWYGAVYEGGGDKRWNRVLSCCFSPQTYCYLGSRLFLLPFTPGNTSTPYSI